MSVTLNTSLTVSGQAGALITALRAFLVTGLGWTEPYSTTNISVFRMPAGTTGAYLRVDDTGTTSAGLRMYEAMTGHSTGTGPFPTVTQSAADLQVTKSNSASSATRPTVFLSNGKLVHMFVYYSATAYNSCEWVCFGDPNSRKPGDAFHTYIHCYPAGAGMNLATSANAAITGHYMARSHTQLGTAINVSKFTDLVRAGSAAFGNGPVAHPDPISGTVNVSPLWILEPSIGAVRADLPGVWSINDNGQRARTQGDTEAGSGALSGRTFMYINLGWSNSQGLIETSNTW